ncbi:MAG: lipid-binding SYLF domain-containing protein [Acidobacteriota bacterium]
MRLHRPRYELMLLAFGIVTTPVLLGAQSDQAERVRNAVTVLEEIMDAADHAIPSSVLDNAEAIAVFPGTIKGGFVLAAQRGKGVISVRDRNNGGWSLPAFLTLTGGSVGAQIGAQSIDIILVVRNRRGLENLLRNQFKVGADGSVTAGPVGRAAEASTDLQMRAQILSYSRARGLFAGVSLMGAAIRQDRDSNEDFYGQPYRTRSIVIDRRAKVGQHAEDVASWRAALAKYAGAK